MTESIEIEVASCSFCGGPASLSDVDNVEAVFWRVECDDDRDCGAVGLMYTSKHDSLVSWNQRAGIRRPS